MQWYGCGGITTEQQDIMTEQQWLSNHLIISGYLIVARIHLLFLSLIRVYET